jgi:hypothetical protein
MVDLQQRLGELDLLDAPDMRVDIERRAAQLIVSSQESLQVTDPIPPRWRGPLIALGTAVAILVIIAAAALALRTDPGDVTDTTVAPTPTTVSPPETTTPPTTAPQAITVRDAGSAEDRGWTYIESPLGREFQRLANGTWVILDSGWACRGEHGFSKVCSSRAPTVPPYDAVADPLETLWTSADGIDWTPAEVPEFAGKVVYESPIYTNHDQLWAWVSPIDEFTPSEVWLTDDAVTWHPIHWITSEPVPPNPWFSPESITRFDDTIYMTATSVLLNNMHLVSTDGGRTFAEITPFPDDSYVAAHWSADGEIGVFVAEPAEEHLTLWKTHNGQDWDRIGDVSGAPQDVLTVSSSQGVLLARQPYAQECDTPLIRSVDGGLTWKQIDVAGGLPLDHPAPLVQGCWVGTADDWFLLQNNDDVWTSHNGIDWYAIHDVNIGYGMFGDRPCTSRGCAMPPSD